jgi:signal transduction histidine kinase
LLSVVNADQTGPSQPPSPAVDGSGQVAGGLAALHRQSGILAHDFNNLLGIIVGATEKLSADLDPGAEQHHLAEVALRAAERGTELLRRMLALRVDAPAQVDGACVIDCAQVLQDILVLAHQIVPEPVEIWTSAPSELLNCVADGAGLEGALINLCLNASDAMPRGGVLRIDARPVELGRDAAGRLGVEPGPYVALAVRDDGCGMSDAVLARAMEPLVTTKRDSGGTGLGLASVSDFARSVGGAFTLASREGLGTVATLYLPRQAGQPEQAGHAVIAA